MEFDYQRGRTDVVVLTSDGEGLLAFEAKLHKWREALQQAYRNTCFAHHSYVLLPKSIALRVQKCSAEFKLRHVGLCYIDGKNIVIVLPAERQVPLEPWLLDEATKVVRSDKRGTSGSRTRRSRLLSEAAAAVQKESGGRHIQADLSGRNF
jgi:hypothetical protein